MISPEMANNLLVAVEITLVGMGLVFASIFLLWGVMALLVRLAPEKEGAGAEEAAAQDAAAELGLKRRAAVAAVSAALAQHTEGQLHEFPLPPTAIVSAWQAVKRSNMLNRRGPVR